MTTERIVSAGVFTNENDLTFLPAGIASIGAAFVGPTNKGPAFVPMQVNNYQEFELMFGNSTLSESYIPYAVKSYLKNAASATIVRILGNGGWSYRTNTNKLAALAYASTGSASTIKYTIIAGFHSSKNNNDSDLDMRASTSVSGNIINSFPVTISGSVINNTYRFSINPQNTDYITKVLGTNSENTKIGATSYSNGVYPYVIFQNYGADLNASYGITITGATTTSLGTGNFPFTSASFWRQVTTSVISGHPLISTLSSSALAKITSTSVNKHYVYITTASLLTANVPAASINVLTGSPHLLNPYTGTDTVPYIWTPDLDFQPTMTRYLSGSFELVTYSSMVNGTTTWTFDGGNSNLQNGFGSITLRGALTPIIVTTSASSSFIPAVSIITSSQDVYFPDYSHASTPWIISGYVDPITLETKQLFKFHHLGDGESTNTDIKISISNLREYTDDYSTFDVIVRAFNDTDKRVSVLESFRSVNLNPDSPQFIARVIGDKYKEFNHLDGRVYTYGDYNSISKYVRVEVSQPVKEGSINKLLSPRGFEVLKQTYIGFANTSTPQIKYVTSQIDNNGTYSSNTFLGWDFSYSDNQNYLKPIPSLDVNGEQTINAPGGNFVVDNFAMPANSNATYTGSLIAKVDLAGINGPLPENVQFTVPFQGGCDGMSPARRKMSGDHITSTNSFGFNLATANSSGSKSYKSAFDILANQDQYDMNILVAPGLIRRLHPYITDYMVSICENRQDTFTVIDTAASTDTVATAVNSIEGLDTNYAATYYPWIKVLDTNTNKYAWVPPSTLIPGVLAYNDNVSAEWYAPAGLNRGGLSDATDVKISLYKQDKDILYENKINPISPSLGQGIFVWGQKTLQTSNSALDRVNVRRLLIAVKKYIASTSKYLVFEHNTSTTRNRFINIVNPYLESIQQRLGLYAFRVVMDETNNTGDVIDRNMLIGDIYLQPSRVAEYIIINFNLTPTGASFGD